MYKICENEDAEDLSLFVQHEMEKGWKPQGGVSAMIFAVEVNGKIVGERRFFQAMVK